MVLSGCERINLSICRMVDCWWAMFFRGANYWKSRLYPCAVTISSYSYYDDSRLAFHEKLQKFNWLIHYVFDPKILLIHFQLVRPIDRFYGPN